MKFALINLGCKVNRVETDSIGAALLDAGWEHVAKDADIAIINTCTVTAEADRKTRKEVNRALVANPQASIMVTGCAATMNPQAYRELSERVRIIEKSEVVEECYALDSSTGSYHAPAPRPLRVGDAFPTRVGIKVQDGCDNACTYCIVHVARGKAYSLPFEQCLEEFRNYARAGVREVVLTGIDLGAYQAGGKNLAGLVSALRQEAPQTRLRISSIEPNTIDDELIELLAQEEGMVCRHLHIPLQSGSAKVLLDMARRYTAEQYRATIEKIRTSVPTISLSTDIIVGFPGEREEDFADTLALARACAFSRIHIFRYSKREGTPAAARSDQIPPEIKAERIQRMTQLAQDLRREDALKRLGTTERVLVESRGRGMSESYYEVRMPQDAQRGSLVEAQLRSYQEKDGIFEL